MAAFLSWTFLPFSLDLHCWKPLLASSLGHTSIILERIKHINVANILPIKSEEELKYLSSIM